MSNIFRLEDKRISATNISLEIEIGDYIEIAKKILDNNKFQRKRVKSSSTIYALLKEDLKIGCVMPPLVLAVGKEERIELFKDEFDSNRIIDYLKNNIKELLILDGLQRSYTLIDLYEEMQKQNDEIELELLNKRKMRIDVYVGLNRLGILYRMLTLNTGQTPMSLRHQIEILYSDYIEQGIDGITFLTEVDEQRATSPQQYNFKDVIDGFTSYLERNELPIEKSDLLENILGLEKLSKENQDINLFKGYIKSFNQFVNKTRDLANKWHLNPDDYGDYDNHPFGTDVDSIFKRSQVLTAFGAAVGKLVDFKKIVDFNSLNTHIEKIVFKKDADYDLKVILKNLESVRKNSKKIGNAQRMYFQYYFRELFNPETDSYTFIGTAAENAYKKYQSQI